MTAPIMNPESSAKIFIGRLSLEAGEEDVRALVSHFGEILEVCVLRDKKRNKSKGAAFVRFRELEAAQAAIRDLCANKTTMDPSLGPLSVKLADGEAKKHGLQYLDIPPEQTQSKIFIGGVPHEFTRKDLMEWTSNYGDVVDCYILTDKRTGKSKGAAFVVYASAEDTHKAMASLSGYVFPQQSRPVNVQLADAPQKDSKKKQGKGGNNKGQKKSGNNRKVQQQQQQPPDWNQPMHFDQPIGFQQQQQQQPFDHSQFGGTDPQLFLLPPENQLYAAGQQQPLFDQIHQQPRGDQPSLQQHMYGGNVPTPEQLFQPQQQFHHRDASLSPRPSPLFQPTPRFHQDPSVSPHPSVSPGFFQPLQQDLNAPSQTASNSMTNNKGFQQEFDFESSQMWIEHLAADGRVYYHNSVTGMTQWDRPVQQLSLPIAANTISPMAPSVTGATTGLMLPISPIGDATTAGNKTMSDAMGAAGGLADMTTANTTNSFQPSPFNSRLAAATPNANNGGGIAAGFHSPMNVAAAAPNVSANAAGFFNNNNTSDVTAVAGWGPRTPNNHNMVTPRFAPY